jgi:methylphosphotriester-DNA--protein-cysteine methyltransferase
MHLLFGQCLPLDNFILGAKVDSTIAQLIKARTDTERLKVIEDFLIPRLNIKAKDELIAVAVELIKQGAGNIEITLLAERLKISLSRFEKRFRRLVGAAPKKFSSIVRLRTLINAAPIDNNMTRLGLDAGFSDQAHFIKAFKLYTGITPKKYFKK